MLTEPEDQDLICYYPDAVAEYLDESEDDAAVTVDAESQNESPYAIKFDGQCFVRAFATLPLTANIETIGFGLWVQLDESDYETYLANLESDLGWESSEFDGILANDWIPFSESIGSKVHLKASETNSDLHIVSIQTDNPDLARIAATGSALEITTVISTIQELLQS